MANSKKDNKDPDDSVLADPVSIIFDAADTSEVKDGLSLEEWSAYAKEKYPLVSDAELEREFKKADTDSDGTVSLEEFKAYVD